MQYDYQILEENFKKLPIQIQEALSSSDVSSAVLAIGKKHGLMLDKIEKLSDIVSYVLLGLIKTNRLVDVLSSELEIPIKQSTEIVTDINEQVFSEIKLSLHKIQEQADLHAENNTDIESAGNFTIEKDGSTESSEISGTETPTGNLNPEKILNSIENPTFHNSRPINVLEAVKDNNSIADHMLAGTVAQQISTVEVSAVNSATATPTPAPTPNPIQKVDPYREEV